MTETNKTILMASLTNLLEKWLDENAEIIDAYHADELSRTMATGAIAVLEANVNMEEFIRREDPFRD